MEIRNCFTWPTGELCLCSNQSLWSHCWQDARW